MNRNKRIVLFLCLIILLTIPLTSLAEDNAGSGDGSTSGAVKGKGYYRSGEWMYKVSIYVGLKDTAETSSSFYHNYTNIGESVFVKPSSYTIPTGTIFAKNNKVDYLRGAGLESYSNPKIITDNPPPIPITHGGNLQSVKNYFGDTHTLEMILNAIAKGKNTSWEGLISNIDFTIEGKKGKQEPKDILPMKEGDKYTNKVPWVIIYEPVAIAHLKDEKTKLAFTATEYAIAQRDGLFDFFYSGANAQHIAGMTHANLPNSVVLEMNWFGYTAYSPTKAKEKWSNNRILQGGGWGMRFLRPNGSNTQEPIIPPVDDYGGPGEFRNLNIGDYRVDTDVITSFTVGTNGRITPDKPATITIYVDGRVISTTDIVLPQGGSQLVWAKWHTPSKPQVMNVSATISGNSNAYFLGGNNKHVKIVDLNENIPPDPVAKDPRTGKPIQMPKGFRIPLLPRKANNTSATWGEWSAFWKSDWIWYEDWQWNKYLDRWVNYGEWIDEGDWEYFWNQYSASLSATNNIKPDEKVPTSKEYYNTWEMKSGYGINIDVSTNVLYNSSNSDVTGVQNIINYFPEFNYSTYCRLSEKVSGGTNARFQLKKNKYSPYNQRAHYTPLWFPDGEKYTTYSEVIDLWTPAGMLSLGLDDYINIKGNLFDDWRVVPRK